MVMGDIPCTPRVDDDLMGIAHALFHEGKLFFVCGADALSFYFIRSGHDGDGRSLNFLYSDAFQYAFSLWHCNLSFFDSM